MDSLPPSIIEQLEADRQACGLSYTELAKLIRHVGDLQGTGVKVSDNHLAAALQGRGLLSWGRLTTLLDIFGLELIVRRKNS